MATVKAEVTNDGVVVNTNGEVNDQVICTCAIIGSIVSGAVEFDEKCGQDIAKSVVYEIMRRTQSLVQRKYGFDIFDIDRTLKSVVELSMMDRDMGLMADVKKEGEK